jgi:peptide methionine sulfoxide reductase MsrB
MSKPNIDIQVEPTKSGKAEYLRLAARDSDGKTGFKLVLRLRLQNNESHKVTVTGITFSFPGSTQNKKEMKQINGYDNMALAAGAYTYWSNGIVPDSDPQINNAIYRDGSAPDKVKIELFCKDHNGNAYSEAVTKTLDLIRHKSPVAGDAYIFPYSIGDLRDDEYMSASAVHWANGGSSGPQIFAHDVGCTGWDDDLNGWSSLVPKGNRLKNKDYRIYDKPVLAVADGFVYKFADDTNENTITEDEDGNLQFPDPPPAEGSGNYIIIQCGTELMKYCHFRRHTIPAALKVPNAPVVKGQELGRVGNTGNATNPHTHIECTRQSDGALRPIPFLDGFVVDWDQLSASSQADAPWFRLEAHGIPKDSVAVWPCRRHPRWNGWQDLGGATKASPAVASWAAHRLDVFSAGKDDQLTHKWWDGDKWHDWQTLGGNFKGGPAAVSWDFDRIDVFVRGMDNHLGHLWWDGDEWKGWQDLGGNLTSAPAVCSWAPHRLDVFAAGSDNNLKHKWYDGTKWHDWQNIGGQFKGAPAAVSWGPHRIDVFVRGTDDHLGHILYNGSDWSGWEDLGGPITSAPAVASWEPDRLDVFAAGQDGNLMRKSWNGEKWGDWEWIGGEFTGNPAAVSWGKNRIDVFVRGLDNHLGHLWRK